MGGWNAAQLLPSERKKTSSFFKKISRHAPAYVGDGEIGFYRPDRSFP
jgi:hypothetical protein